MPKDNEYISFLSALIPLSLYEAVYIFGTLFLVVLKKVLIESVLNVNNSLSFIKPN